MTGKESSRGATDLESRVAGTVHGDIERRALCVDLDGTLVATDTLWESLLVLVKKRPSVLLLLPLWLLRGRAFLKQQVALRAPLDPAGLPYRADVLLFLKKERALGRRLILATGADESIARKIADHLGIFSAVLASDGKINLTGRRKVRALKDFLGGVGYDYAGNSVTDVQVWREADRAILVDAPEWTLRKVARRTTIEAVFPSRRIDLSVFLRAVRVHQWIKNLLVFVPLIVAHKVTDAHLILQASLAFLALSLCASGAYIINDLLDLGADRAHPKKRTRPFAAGLLRIDTGLFLAPCLIVAGFGIAAVFLSGRFVAGLGVYLAASVFYSLGVKRIVVADVLVLAGLYMLRILLGGVAVSIPISFWLLAFAVFFFLSLAFLKRYCDLHWINAGEHGVLDGRGYEVADREIVGSIGSASGCISVLVVALYINSADVVVLYQSPEVLWLIGPVLLYWITRIWFLAHRGRIVEDPVLFTVRDPVTYWAAGAILAVMAIASIW